MGAPKQNQFWKLRSKHGREKLFATSSLLWEAACEYFQWCDENPWLRVEQLKRPFKDVSDDGEETLITNANLPTQRPYTLSGLGLYLSASERFITEFERSILGKDDQESKDFIAVITHIREIINTQQFEGATVGAFNSNIIARKLGLTEKKDITTDGESINKGYWDFLKQVRTNE